MKKMVEYAVLCAIVFVLGMLLTHEAYAGNGVGGYVFSITSVSMYVVYQTLRNAKETK